jgi:hypothetical protein
MKVFIHSRTVAGVPLVAETSDPERLPATKITIKNPVTNETLCDMTPLTAEWYARGILEALGDPPSTGQYL